MRSMGECSASPSSTVLFDPAQAFSLAFIPAEELLATATPSPFPPPMLAENVLVPCAEQTRPWYAMSFVLVAVAQP